jgi:hypothetical protein
MNQIEKINERMKEIVDSIDELLSNYYYTEYVELKHQLLLEDLSELKSLKRYVQSKINRGESQEEDWIYMKGKIMAEN